MLAKIELIRLLKRWEIYVALLIGFAMIIIQAITIYPENANFMNSAYIHLTGFDFTGAGSNLYYFILPIMSGLAATSIYSEDKHQGLLNFILMRKSKRVYLRINLMISFLVGGFVGAIPLIVEGAYFFTRYSTTNVPADLFSAGGWVHNWFYTSPMSFWWMSILIVFLYSGLFSILGIACSYVAKRKKVEMAFPFLVVAASFLISNYAGIDNLGITYILPPTFSNDYVGSQYFLIGIFLLGLLSVLLVTAFEGKRDEVD
ncbi:hypothetical protein [Pediococcus cellicola]|uniref:Uncharacterized protein n=1 Tax=Pediococcus cellicola TaxID=319652 RepID=A0A0R2IMH6_9LACO|nr:hypothetical protein [Pediococcus cellicola]KRN66209.1 hypothetical protein IV80_GL001457 [Pediococcus cellicola]GEL15224.1 hypothetical protein PCE01_10260 [Pediococcus cellicola]